jgi:hypothetical protein
MTLYRVNENTRLNFTLGSTRCENYICGPKEVTFTATNDFTLKMTVSSGAIVFVDWGDGSLTSWTCNGSEQTVLHDYAAPGSYAVKISGSLGSVTTFGAYYVYGNVANIISCLPGLAGNGSSTGFELYDSATHGESCNVSSVIIPAALKFFACDGINLVGDIKNLILPANLSRLYLRSMPAGLTGNIHELNTPVSAAIVVVTGTACSADFSNAGCWPKTINAYYDYSYNTACTCSNAPIPAMSGCVINVKSCGLSSASVDNFLINFADGIGTPASLDIAGSNAARTAASDAAKLVILATGCALTVNE